MAVISTEKGDSLTLEIDNGEFTALKKCIEQWGFLDYPSFLRFAISIIGDTEDKSIWIKSKGNLQPVFPAKPLLKNNGA